MGPSGDLQEREQARLDDVVRQVTLYDGRLGGLPQACSRFTVLKERRLIHHRRAGRRDPAPSTDSGTAGSW